MNGGMKLMAVGVSAVAILLSRVARAEQFDLDSNNTVIINGALFQALEVTPAGTGVTHPIVRLQNKGVEEGYNTSGRKVPFDEKSDPNFTCDLQLSNLMTFEVDGTSYYKFMLDINQPKASSNRLLSLDVLQIYTSPTGSQTTKEVSSLGALRFNLGDNYLMLDASQSHGSGSGDMFFFVPTSMFTGASSSDFLYLYSKFGMRESALGGFEEWAAVIPEPNTLGLLAFGGVLLGLVLRYRQQSRDGLK
jgi:hypothetical protein